MGKVFIQYRSNSFLTIVNSTDSEVTLEIATNMIQQSHPFYPIFKKLKYCKSSNNIKKTLGVLK